MRQGWAAIVRIPLGFTALGAFILVTQGAAQAAPAPAAAAPPAATSVPGSPVSAATPAPRTPAGPAVPSAQPTVSPGAGLTNDQLSRLLTVVDSKGTNFAVPAMIASALGLSDKQYAPTLREVTFQGDNGVKHGFAALNDRTGFFLFSRDPSGHVSVYRTGTDWRLLRAASDFETNHFLEIPQQRARRGLQDELRQWSAVLSPPSAAASSPQAATPQKATSVRPAK